MSEATTPSAPRRRTATERSAGVVSASVVTFRYRPTARAVIDHLDMTIMPGELVAVVGPSGAGKTTLLHIVQGLMAPSSGQVEVAAGCRVTLLPQEPYVFTGSLRDNLTYLAESVSDGDLLACVHTMGLEPLMSRLGGLEGVLAVGSADPPLTAEERQRIVLARAHLSGADLLLLDEAMSHLDPDGELQIEQALRAPGRTLVVAAHRLDVARRADRIVYFDGRDVHVGTHRSLVESCSDYRELVAYAQSMDPHTATLVACG